MLIQLSNNINSRNIGDNNNVSNRKSTRKVVFSPCIDLIQRLRIRIKVVVTTVILENQEKSIKEDRSFLKEAAPTNATGADVENWDPILISLVRRSMPNLIAYDICGVQPMTGPTGLIFFMRARFASMDGTEALGDEADSGFSNDDAAGDLTSSVMTGSNPATLNDKQKVGTYLSPTI